MAAALGAPVTKVSTRRRAGAFWLALGNPRLDFYRFFDDPERHRKNNDFSNPQKSTKMAESIDPGAPKVDFWSKNLYFWAPFWHRFFDFLTPSFWHRFFHHFY